MFGCSPLSLQSNKDCNKLAAGVEFLKKKIGLMTKKATCYNSSTGIAGKSCTIQQLMGGVGGSTVPQNALDMSINKVALGGRKEALISS